MMRPRRTARYLTAASVVLASLTVAACGDDEAPEVCAAVDSLVASIGAVTTVDLSENALEEVQDDLDQVQSDLSRVRDEAEDEYADEVDAVDEAFSSVTTSLEAAIDAPSSQAITDLGTALGALGTSLSGLVAAVESTC